MALKTLANALNLLSFFTREQPVWGVRDLAKTSGMHHAVVHRTLATFAEAGFLYQDRESQKYALGIRFYELGLQVKERLHLADLVRPAMNRLAQLTGETVFLTFNDGLEGVCVEIAESPNSLKYTVEVGTRFPMYAGANAKVILAYMGNEQREIIRKRGIKQLSKNTKTDWEEIEKQLETIKKDGWSYTEEEFSEGTFGIAVPLFTGANHILGSLGIAGPLFRMGNDRVPYFVELLKEQQDVIEKSLFATVAS
ncbi:IclR family transcriptional regulator [Zobellella maritima]|uniref:IclR family transcriptional regulator n=1 Tax=Zobellella maritima TaxID=2059725 RepID=UPI000E309FD2|nr:IclR family transcriptional regulator [Zobellella maritima]